MSLINQTFEYLPDIDDDVSDSSLEAIKLQLQASFPADASTTPHPSLPPAYEPRFSELIVAEHKRLAAAPISKMQGGIDTSRYEALSAPDVESKESWRTTLQRAYTAHEYLSIRNVNLGLLEEHGKNAWLISNAELEAELGALEKELALVTAQAQVVEDERRVTRDGVKAEFEVLGESWKTGIGRALETEIAAEDLRRQILDQRRNGGAGD